MSKSKRFWLTGVAFVAPFLWLFYPVNRIEVTLTESGQHCLLEKQFSLEWIHSVEKTPWREYYRLYQGKLLLYQSDFKTFGAGTPSEGEMKQNQEGFVSFNTHLKLPAIHWITSRNARSTLYNHIEIPWPIYLEQPDYAEVMIVPRRLLRIFSLIKDQCYDANSGSQ